MPINRDRLIDRIERLAEIGRTPSGGITRPAWSDAYWQAHALVKHWMAEAGLDTHRDAAGNLIGRREGRAPGAPALILGSHIDTVVNGGRYDGAAGILAAIEVAQALREDGVTLDHALETIAFIEEEGSRFGIGLFGSRAMLGDIDSDVRERRDREGRPFDEVVHASGLDPARLHEAARDPRAIAAYLEMHIEQGVVLEQANLSVGIVSGIVGLLSLSLTLTGRADHAGGTPMTLRHDALAGAAELVLATEQLARQRGPHVVGTVGRLEARPGQYNVIPGQVSMSFDLRAMSEAARNGLEIDLRHEITRVCRERGLTSDLRVLARVRPVQAHPTIVEALADACARLDLPIHYLPSGAGHDAQAIGSHAPAGMVFVRCREGISHSPDEYASPADLEAGVRVLYATTVDLDTRPLSRNYETLVNPR